MMSRSSDEAIPQALMRRRVSIAMETSKDAYLGKAQKQRQIPWRKSMEGEYSGRDRYAQSGIRRPEWLVITEIL